MYGCFDCTCVPHAWYVHRGPKRASDPLRRKLEMVGSCHIGAGNRTWVLQKGSQCTSPLNHLASSYSATLANLYEPLSQFLGNTHTHTLTTCNKMARNSRRAASRNRYAKLKTDAHHGCVYFCALPYTMMHMFLLTMAQWQTISKHEGSLCFKYNLYPSFRWISWPRSFLPLWKF